MCALARPAHQSHYATLELRSAIQSCSALPPNVFWRNDRSYTVSLRVQNLLSATVVRGCADNYARFMDSLTPAREDVPRFDCQRLELLLAVVVPAPADDDDVDVGVHVCSVHPRFADH